MVSELHFDIDFMTALMEKCNKYDIYLSNCAPKINKTKTDAEDLFKLFVHNFTTLSISIQIRICMYMSSIPDGALSFLEIERRFSFRSFCHVCPDAPFIPFHP